MESSEDDQYQAWWERVWKEREDELQRHFGVSHPPGAPEGYVSSFVTCGGELKLLIPGACALVCPPRDTGILIPHRNWLYIGHGLAQPEGPEDTPHPPEDWSGLGVEFAIITPAPGDWAADLISFLMGYALKADPQLNSGDRIPFGFISSEHDKLGWFVGRPDDHRVRPIDETRAMLIWRMLGAPPQFTTSTGNFELLVGTSITHDEWEFAKETSSAHLLLLLVESGIGQACVPGRSSIVANSGASLLARVRELSIGDATREVDAVSANAWL